MSRLTVLPPLLRRCPCNYETALNGHERCSHRFRVPYSYWQDQEEQTSIGLQHCTDRLTAYGLVVQRLSQRQILLTKDVY
jgi:hypothetical protein